MATTVFDNTYFSTKFFYENDFESGPYNNVSNGPCTVHAITVLNAVSSATENYLKIYDTAEEITANSTEADFVFRIGTDQDATICFGASGLSILNGLTVRMPSGQAVSSVDNPGATAKCNIVYT